MEVSRAKLIEVVGRVLPAVAKKETFEQADKLAFAGGRVVAYNDAISISARLPELGDIEGAIDGRRFHALLSKLSAETVTLERDGNAKLVLRGGRSKTAFDVLPVALPIDQIDGTGDDVPLPSGFLAALGMSASCCAKTMNKPAVTCVRFGEDGLEGADGFRAVRFHFPDAGLPTALLPATAAEEVVGFPVESVAVSDGGEWMRFVSHGGDTTIYARLLSGAYPALAKFYVVDGDPIALPATLSEVLDRAGIFAKRDVRIDEEVEIELRPNQIVVGAKCDGADFSEIVRWEGKASAAFAITPRLFVEALASGTSCVIGKGSIKFVGPSWEHVVALR